MYVSFHTNYLSYSLTNYLIKWLNNSKEASGIFLRIGAIILSYLMLEEIETEKNLKKKTLFFLIFKVLEKIVFLLLFQVLYFLPLNNVIEMKTDCIVLGDCIA